VTSFDELSQRASALGLAVRGAFLPNAGELDQALPGVSAGTVVLLGFTGGLQWEQFRDSAEAHDGEPNPLDRWSRRLIGSLAREFGAVDVYPSGSPTLPFQRLASRAEPVHQSPIGLLIHPRWGLWHAYRGALVLEERIELPRLEPKAHPCTTCAAKPCLSSCPVGAFSGQSYDLKACVDHVLSEAGSDCRENGCRARRACPVGSEFAYGPEQARFHMQAFLRAARSR